VVGVASRRNHLVGCRGHFGRQARAFPGTIALRETTGTENVGALRYFEQARSATRERQARDHYCRTAGVTVEAVCVQNLQRPWQRASLDGLSADGAHALEIKCGQSTYAATAARQRPARRQYPQLQHILAVTGLAAIDYYCFCPPHPALRLSVPRDEPFIQRLIAAEECFWQRLAPSLTAVAG
jgi:hypothetical protein